MMSQSLLSGNDSRILGTNVRAILDQAEQANGPRYDTIYKWLDIYSTHRYVPGFGYYKARNGASYSYHFIIYSALNVPGLALTKVLHISPYVSFIITNGLIVLCTIVFILKYEKLNWLGRLALLATYVFCGTSFYLTWPAPKLVSSRP